MSKEIYKLINDRVEQLDMSRLSNFVSNYQPTRNPICRGEKQRAQNNNIFKNGVHDYAWRKHENSKW